MYGLSLKRDNVSSSSIDLSIDANFIYSGQSVHVYQDAIS